jgi:hypothetical protein
MGAEDVPSNAGTQLQRLGRNVADQPGPGASKLDRFVKGRQAGQLDRYGRALKKNISPLKDPQEVSDVLTKKTEDLVSPLYRRGGDDVIIVPKSLRVDLSKPSVRAAWPRAKELAAEYGEQLEPIFTENGKFNPKLEQVSAKTLHRVREALDDMIDDEMTIVAPGVKEMSKKGVALSNTRKRIDAALKAGSKSYKRADKIFTTTKMHQGSIKQGLKFDRMEAEQVDRFLKEGSPKKKAMFRLGAAWRILKKASKLTDASGEKDLSTSFLASPEDRKKLLAMTGGDDGFDKMMTVLQREREMAKSFGKITGGSRTSAQQADMAEESGLLKGVAAAIRSGPYQSAKNGIANIVEAMGGMTQQERSVIADILTETDDRAFVELMEEIAGIRTKDRNLATVLGTAAQAATLSQANDSAPEPF